MTTLHVMIELLIAENGGRERYAEKIEAEWVKQKRPQQARRFSPNRKWSEKDDVILRDNFHKMRNKDIGILLNRSKSSVSGRAYTLIEKGLLERKFSWGGRK